ncbi:hypothetical protein Tco_0654840 [Tanacetum coccineum]|uniref:Uncharacterized protein n=1 Tax=Tanacetum coccineum TaxID=301880 RepID=A0ABQ4X4B5_9ASTR
MVCLREGSLKCLGNLEKCLRFGEGKQTKEDTRSLVAMSTPREDELRLCDSFVVCEPLKCPKELVGFTPRRRIGFRMELVQGATPICEGSCRLTSLERQEVWNDCRSCKVRVGSNGNLLWEASVLLGRKKGGVRVTREDDRGVSEGREDVREVFQQCGSGAKRKLSRCGRNQIGNEPILALPEGADNFIVYYDAQSKDLEACLEKGEGDCLYVATTEGSYEGLHG